MPRTHGTPAQGWWDGHAAPTTGPTGTSTTWVGVLCKFTVPGRVFGISFWDGTGLTSALNNALGVMVSDLPAYPDRGKAFYLVMAPSQSNKWMHAWFSKPVRINTADTYRVAVVYLNGGFFRTNNALVSPVTRNGITLVSSFQTTSLDIGSSTLTTNVNANAIDVLFQPD